jgi:ABC-type bacteriocin/lantibiotic exporter with double-glycine peptidase domain
MNTLNLIKSFVTSNKQIFIIYIFFSLLSYPLESLVIPNLFGSFFADIKNGSNNYKTFFFKIIFFTLLINFSYSIMSYIDSIIISDFNEYAVNELYKKILLSYKSEFQELELGKIISRLNTLPGVIRELSTDLFNWLLPRAISIIITVIYFFYINTQLGLITTGFLFLLFYYNFVSYSKCVKLSEKRYNKYEERAEKTQDKLSNLFSIYSSSNVDNEIKKYKNTNTKYKNLYLATMLCSSKIKSFNNFIQCLMFIVLNGFVIYQFKINKMSFAQMISLNMIISFLIPCIATIMKALPDYTNHVGIIKSIDEFLTKINKSVITKPNLLITNGSIKIKSLSFGYKNNKLFDNFNLDIKQGQFIGLIGESGNGKSTLIKLIMGYFEVEPNTIFIDDKDITLYSIDSIRKQIIYLNQNTKLFNETIYYNIQYGNTLTIEQINELVKKFNLDKIFINLTNGLYTKAGVNGDTLSGGQKQIIQLLRLYGSIDKSKIAIFDEPTAAVDPETKHIVLNIIKDLTKNLTTILITHDTTNLSIVNRIVKISNGKIIEDKSN